MINTLKVQILTKSVLCYIYKSNPDIPFIKNFGIGNLYLYYKHSIFIIPQLHENDIGI